MVFTISLKQGAHGTLVVITDTDIVGSLFEEGKRQLDLRSEFYKGERKGKDHATEIVKASRHIYFTGKQAVALGVELKLIDSKRILVVKGIPHATVVLEL